MKDNKRVLYPDIKQENLIECDNCDYVIPNPDGCVGADLKGYVDKPCPKCGANLLTKEDYELWEKHLEALRFSSKFILSSDAVGDDVVQVSVKVHDGIKIHMKNLNKKDGGKG